MQNRRFRLRKVFAVSVVLLLLAINPGLSYADSASSENYRVNETSFGVGGGSACSGEYCSTISVGDTVVGGASSENYRAQFGFNTSREPFLEVWTEGNSSNLGTLDVDTTGTATSLIKVRNYLSAGYTIHIVGEPPTQGSHNLTAMSVASTSQQGAEQFGINMVNNTAPDLGADPVQVPDDDFSFGYAFGDYAQANLFKYEDGAVVAKSDRSSGETDFTLSMIINVSNVTPGGKYAGSFAAVVVPTF